MYALFTRFTARCGESYMHAPFTTAFFSSLVIKGGGDVAAQIAIERRETWDRRRTAIMAVFACFVGGWGNAIFLRTVSSTFRPESMGRLRAALASAACDVFGFCPFFLRAVVSFMDGDVPGRQPGEGARHAADRVRVRQLAGRRDVRDGALPGRKLSLCPLPSSAAARDAAERLRVQHGALHVINMRAERRIGAA